MLPFAYKSNLYQVNLTYNLNQGLFAVAIVSLTKCPKETMTVIYALSWSSYNCSVS